MIVKTALITAIIKEEIAKDAWGTLERVAAIGYRGVEIGSTLGGLFCSDAEGSKRRLDDIGLETFSYGTVLNPGAGDVEAAIDVALALECRYIVTFWAPCESRDQVLVLADFLNSVGSRIKERGLTFCYHNHDHEFREFDGERGIDILMAHTEPDLVKAEVDIAWVRFAGADPAAHIRKYSGRCPLIHVKDIDSDTERGAWAEVGTGIVDLPASLSAGIECGADWFIVEQDQAVKLAPMESIEVSLRNLEGAAAALA